MAVNDNGGSPPTTTGGTNDPTPDDGYAESTFDKLMKVLDALTPDAIATAIGDYNAGGTIAQFIEQLGEDITSTLSSSVSKFGGVIVNGLTGALDPDVATGFFGLYQAATDANPYTHGLLNQNQNRQLRQVLQELNSTPPATKPVEANGTDSRFDVPETAGTITPLDPPVSYGLLYTSNNAALFKSIVLPQVAGNNSSYDIYTETNGIWAFYQQAQPLQKLTFSTPVGTFLVSGVDTSQVPSSYPWVSGVSLDRTGSFVGAIDNLTQAQTLSLAPVIAAHDQNYQGPLSSSFDIPAVSSPTTVTLSGNVGNAAVAKSVSLYENGDLVAQQAISTMSTAWSFNIAPETGQYDAFAVTVEDGDGGSQTTAVPDSIKAGIVGAPYTTRVKMLNDTGVLTGETYYNATGSIYKQDTVTTSDIGDTIYDYSNGSYFTDQNFSSYQNVLTSDGKLAVATYADKDGTHRESGFQDGQTLVALGSDHMTGGGQNETFFFRLRPGQETITDFLAAGSGHDVISLPSTEFTSIAQVLQQTSDVAGSAVISLAPGSSITIQNVTKEQLVAQKGDLALHL